MARSPVSYFGLAALVGGLATLASCSAPALFRPEGYFNKVHEYSVRYSDPAHHAFLSADWVVDNYYTDTNGSPTSRKNGDAYRRPRKLEFDDGSVVEDAIDLFDLKLVHKRTNAVIWLRTIPVTPREGERNLRVIAQDYAEGLSGTGFFATDTRPIKVGAQQFATRIVEAREGMLDGFQAYDATIEIANVDQLRLDPKTRSGIIRVVFARTPFQVGFGSGGSTGLHRVPVILMAGYYNNPTDYAAQLPEFERFLSLFDARRGASAGWAPATSGSTEASSVAAPPSATPAPAVSTPSTPPP